MHHFHMVMVINAVTKILDEIFLPVAKQFKPDLIIFSAGYDSHHLDPLGGLRLTCKFLWGNNKKISGNTTKNSMHTRRWI